MKIKVKIASAAPTLYGEVLAASSTKAEPATTPKVRYKKIRGVSKTAALKLPFERDETADSSAVATPPSGP